MKVCDINDELSIFRVFENVYLLVLNNYSSIQLVAGAKDTKTPEFVEKDKQIVVSKTIKELVTKDENPLIEDELTHYLKSNYFTGWFIKLLSFIPSEYREKMTKKEQVSPMSFPLEKEKEKLEAEEKKPLVQKNDVVSNVEPIVKKPVVKQAIFNPPLEKETKPVIKRKEKIDGAQYEKLILAELQEAYRKRLEKKKAVSKQEPSPKLKHVKFAPKEILIPYNKEDDCLELLLRKTRQNGCRLSSDDWLILLTNKVDEQFAEEIERHYPNHVTYTDDPDKGNLRIAFIVNLVSVNKSEEPIFGVKRIKSKTASFVKEIPSGAFENIDDEDYLEAMERKGNGEIRRVKSKVATFTPKLPENDFDDFDDFDLTLDEDGFLTEENVFEDIGFEEETENDQETKEPILPHHWHCYLCGKKKLYSGEPAETVKLANGSTVYLCKKHRGKM